MDVTGYVAEGSNQLQKLCSGQVVMAISGNKKQLVAVGIQEKMQIGGMSDFRKCSEQVNVLLETLFGAAKRPERVCLQEVQRTATLNVQYVNKNVAFLKANADPIILDDMSSFKLQPFISQQ